MLREKDIELMRTTQNMALPNVCTRKRTSYVADGIGGRVPDSVDELSGIPCRKSVLGRPVDYMVNGVLAGSTDKVITLPQGSDVVETDYLEIDSTVFEVVGFMSTGEWETALRCLCVVVR